MIQLDNEITAKEMAESVCLPYEDVARKFISDINNQLLSEKGSTNREISVPFPKEMNSLAGRFYLYAGEIMGLVGKYFLEKGFGVEVTANSSGFAQSYITLSW